MKKKYKRCFWNRRNFFSVNNWKSFFMPLKRLSSYVQYAIIYTRRYLDISNEYKCANMQICWHAIHAMSDSCLHYKWKVLSIWISSRKRITLDSFLALFDYIGYDRSGKTFEILCPHVLNLHEKIVVILLLSHNLIL